MATNDRLLAGSSAKLMFPRSRFRDQVEFGNTVEPGFDRAPVINEHNNGGHRIRTGRYIDWGAALQAVLVRKYPALPLRLLGHRESEILCASRPFADEIRCKVDSRPMMRSAVGSCQTIPGSHRG